MSQLQQNNNAFLGWGSGWTLLWALVWMLTVCADSVHHSLLPMDMYGLRLLPYRGCFLLQLAKPASLIHLCITLAPYLSVCNNSTFFLVQLYSPPPPLTTHYLKKNNNNHNSNKNKQTENHTEFLGCCVYYIREPGPCFYLYPSNCLFFIPLPPVWPQSLGLTSCNTSPEDGWNLHDLEGQSVWFVGEQLEL